MTLIKKELPTTVTRENGTYVELFMNDNTGTMGYLDSDGVFVAVGGSGGSDYTETIVNIHSAQILALDSETVQLLPQAGVNSYYDIDRIYIEYIHNTTPYTTDETYLSISGMPLVPIQLITYSQNQFAICKGVSQVDLIEGYNIANISGSNAALNLDCYNGDQITLGDGTLRVKIYHKTITFGA